ncbi:MAG TPA: polysaccharide deacetylase family protein [Candidatus Binatia bacterium]|nr:polysaccharide deacetylase family protein [Candidatus Binatia bacterium]
MKAISLCLHDVLDVERVKPGDVYTLKLTDFSEHLEAIERRSPPIHTIRYRYEWGKQIPVFLTFDDGTAGAYKFAAAELEKYGWRGHFFITTDWIGRDGYMDRDQVRDLHHRGHIIGTHSCSHPERMSHLAPADLLREWKDSCEVLSAIVQCPITTASVAGGYYSQAVAQAAASVGIQVLFNSEPTSTIAVVHNCLVLGRYSVQAFTMPPVSAAIAAGRRWPRWKQSMLWNMKRILKGLGGESYVSFRRRLLSRFMSIKTVEHD